MGKKIGALCVILAGTGAAQAGGVDRSTQSALILFENGNYTELTFGNLSPSVSGTEVPLLGGQSSGNMLTDYQQVNMGVKFQVNEQLDAALIFDKPFGANVEYPTGTGYFAQGSNAELDSASMTALLKYQFASQVSVFGGLRYQTLSANALIPFVTAIPGRTAPYSVNGSESGEWGYVVGIGWEKPEIAARVALTYNSAIDYDISTAETSFRGSLNSETPVTTPQSVNFEFQTGVAPNTLLFGGARWVDWEQFQIAPAMYAALTGGSALVSYNGPTTTYTLGVGYKFNDNWSGAISYAHDTSLDGFQSNLNPVNGYDSIGVAATYTEGALKLTAAVRYYDIGDAQTRAGAVAPAANFTGNDAIGVGVRIGYFF